MGSNKGQALQSVKVQEESLLAMAAAAVVAVVAVVSAVAMVASLGMAITRMPTRVAKGKRKA
jgi:hypothetical protein